MDYERDESVENTSTGDVIKLTLKIYGSILAICVFIYVVVRPLFPLCYNFCNSVKEYNTRLSRENFGRVEWIWKILRYSDDEIAQCCGLTAAVFLRFLRLGIKISIVGIFNSIYLIPVNLYGCEDDDVSQFESLSSYSDQQQQQCSSIVDGVERIGLGHLSQGSKSLLATTISAYVIFGAAMYFIYQEFSWFTAARHTFLTLPRVDNYSVYVKHIPKEFRGDAALLAYFQEVFTPEEVLEAKVALDLFILEGKVSRRKNIVQNLEVKHSCCRFD